VTYTAPSPPSLLVHGAQYPSRSESHTMRYWPIGHAAVEQSLQVLPKRNLPISQVGLSTSDLRPESFSSGKAPRAQRDLGAQEAGNDQYFWIPALTASEYCGAATCGSAGSHLSLPGRVTVLASQRTQTHADNMRVPAGLVRTANARSFWLPLLGGETASPSSDSTPPGVGPYCTATPPAAPPPPTPPPPPAAALMTVVPPPPPFARRCGGGCCLRP